MTHWRTSRATSGAQPRPGSHSARNTPRDRINKFFPPGSILAEPISSSFEHRKLLESSFDKAAMRFAVGFLGAIGLGLVVLYAGLRLVGL